MSEMLYEGEAKQQGHSPNNRTKQAKHRTEQQRSECTAALSLFGSEELHCIRSVESRVNIFMNETHFSSGFVELDDDNDGSLGLLCCRLPGWLAGTQAVRQADKQTSSRQLVYLTGNESRVQTSCLLSFCLFLMFGVYCSPSPLCDCWFYLPWDLRHTFLFHILPVQHLESATVARLQLAIAVF